MIFYRNDTKYKTMRVPFSCNIPEVENGKVTMAHGNGGVLTQKLIEEVFAANFDNPYLSELNDGAVLSWNNGKLAMTSDSFVVSPLFFPGGNIGELAVNGVINDLLCCGAVPMYMSASFIIEEGFEIDKLNTIASSMARVAKENGVYIVTGDTKVVERGKCDGTYISASGIGNVLHGVSLSPKNIKDGDAVIVTAPIAEHGISILTARESLGFEGKVRSDTASLKTMITNLLFNVPNISAIRDATRGGVATVLNEMAEASHKSIIIDESAVPIGKNTAAAAALLGLDPLYIANEGVMVIILPTEYASDALTSLKRDKHGKNAAVIGEVTDDGDGDVYIKTIIGTERILPPLSGEQFPRIC